MIWFHQNNIFQMTWFYFVRRRFFMETATFSWTEFEFWSTKVYLYVKSLDKTFFSKDFFIWNFWNIPFIWWHSITSCGVSWNITTISTRFDGFFFKWRQFVVLIITNKCINIKLFSDYFRENLSTKFTGNPSKSPRPTYKTFIWILKIFD